MANLIHKTTRTVLFASASAFLALFSAGAARAENINFYCGNVEFQLDTTRSTITNSFLSNEPVQWEYDGEWLRWTVTRSNEAFGVNVQNGYFISGGQSGDAGCRVEDPDLLENLPLSEGAELRRIFVDLDLGVRISVQDHLRYLGFYNSTIDGLWGRGTQAALLAYAASLPQQYFTQGDFRSNVGARIVFNQINLGIMEGRVGSPNTATSITVPVADAPFLMSSCIDILRAMNVVLSLEDIEAWEELGVNPYWIDPNLSGEITPQVAAEVCEKIVATEARFIGFERFAKNGSTSITHVTYETNELERERLSIEWGLQRGRVGRTIYNRNAWRARLPDLSLLPSRAVSFIFSETETLGRTKVNCYANYFVFFETHPIVAFTRQRDFLPSVDDQVELYVSIVFGQPFISFRSRTDPSNEAHFFITDTSYVYNEDGTREIFWGIAPTATNAIAIDNWSELQSALSNNFNAFEGEVDFEGALDAFRKVGERRGFSRYTISEAPEREQSDIVNHPACQTALNDARDSYSREIIMFRN